MNTAEATRDRELLRLLHGELTPAQARALTERMAREPELAAAYQRLEGLWQRLELPEPEPAPAGFAGRVLARARERQSVALGWAAAPAWARTAALLALVLGVAGGAGLGLWSADSGAEELGGYATLADQYWDLLDAEEAPPGEVSP